MAYARHALDSRAGVGFALVVLLHAAFIYVLQTGLVVKPQSLHVGPLEAQLIDEPPVEPATPPPPPPEYHAPPVEAIAPPLIAIEWPAESSAITAGAAGLSPPVATAPPRKSVVVPPRLDPQHGLTQPEYPPVSRRLHETGRVILRIHVRADGLPDDVRVETSSGYARLDDAAVRHALRQWRFLPARTDDVQIAAWAEFAVNFVIVER